MLILPVPIWSVSEHREPMEHSDLVGKESSLPPIRLSSCLSPLLSPNSHGINSFADPHPLNPIASILYKNIRGALLPPRAAPATNGLRGCRTLSLPLYILTSLPAHSHPAA